MSEPLIEVLRWPLVEAVFRGDIAVVDASGGIRASVGDTPPPNHFLAFGGQALSGDAPRLLGRRCEVGLGGRGFSVFGRIPQRRAGPY